MPEGKELERLVNNCMQRKGWTKERCQRYIAGGIWGADFTSPTATDVHIPAGLKVGNRRKVSANQNVFTVTSVPVFKAGNHKGQNFTIDDIDEIVTNTNALLNSHLHEPPIKLGHNEEQKLLKNDGLPAGGYVDKIYRIGDQIFVDIGDVPKKVKELIDKRAYSKISAEIYNEFKHPTTGENIGKVLRAVALLGGDVPAIKGLGDIQALYNSEASFTFATFSEKDLQEVNKMERIWTLKDVEKMSPCCVEVVKKYMEEKKKDSITVDEYAEILTKERLSKFVDGAGNPNPECPPDFKWDVTVGRCIPESVTTDNAGKEEERKVCPKGMKWDEASQKCVPAMGEGNPDGQKPDETKPPEAKPDEAKSGQPPKEEGIAEYKDLLKKEPKDWKPEEVAPMIEKYKALPKEKQDELGKMVKADGFPDDLKPPKGWFDQCVSSVSGTADNPEALCGWIYHHAMTPERKQEIEATRQKEDTTKVDADKVEQEKKYAELQEKIKQLQKEKLKKMTEDLKIQNRGILIPALDKYIDKFSEVLEGVDSIVKFDDKELNARELFFTMLSELVKGKSVILQELLKSTAKDDEKFSEEVTDEEKDKIVKKYSEKGEEVKNIELHILAERIEKKEKIPYREALILANKFMTGGK